MDTFFKQYLDAGARSVEAAMDLGPQNSELAGTLSLDTLQAFQRASEIRDAFFQTGGNVPVVQLTVKPVHKTRHPQTSSLKSAAVTASPRHRRIVCPQMPLYSLPQQLQCWYNGREHRFAPRYQRRARAASHQVLERTGPWSLFRLLEAGGISVNGEVATANFAVAGYMLRYDSPLRRATIRSIWRPWGVWVSERDLKQSCDAACSESLSPNGTSSRCSPPGIS